MRRLAAVLALTGLAAGAAVAYPASAGGGDTYVTLLDNADNNWNHMPDAGQTNGDMYPLIVGNADPWHPIEFYIVVTGAVGPGTLSIRAYDIDSGSANADGCGYAELDSVYLNNHPLGTLTGTSDAYSETVFAVPASFVAPGDNRVQVVIDPGHPSTGCIRAMVDWGVLRLNPGVGGTSALSGVTDGSGGATVGRMRLAIAAGAALALGVSAYVLRRRMTHSPDPSP